MLTANGIVPLLVIMLSSAPSRAEPFLPPCDEGGCTTCGAADFGDAPDPPYPTLLLSGGPRHADTTIEWLGMPGAENESSVTRETDASTFSDPDGLPNLILRPQTWRNRVECADLDKYDDGVTFYPTTYRAGETGDMDVTVCVADYAGGRYSSDPDKTLYVNAWIDWNTDGVWSEGDEHVVNGVGLVPSGLCTTLPLLFPVPGFIGTGDLWARVRLDYGEDVGRNDPAPLFESDPSLDLVYGEAQFGEVEDYYIGSDFGNLPDVNVNNPNPPCMDADPPFGGACPPGDPGYPTTFFSNGAHHLDIGREGLGWSATREPDADEGPSDEDVMPNLVGCAPATCFVNGNPVPYTVQSGGNDIGNDGVVGLVTFIDPAQLRYRFFARVTSTISSSGFGTQGRYDMTDDAKRLYVHGWFDKNRDGTFTPDELVMDEVVDPETFGPDQRYTLGEAFNDDGLDGMADTDDKGEGNGRFDFEDINGNGSHDVGEAGEPYTDTAGVDTNVIQSTETVCLGGGLECQLFWLNDAPRRFRVDYGENLANPFGQAAFGEVEDNNPFVSGISCIVFPGDPTIDADQDTFDDVQDNSPLDPNPAQEDLDGDGVGNVSDPDDDNDGIVDMDDNSPKTPNPGQEDSDGDGDGDATDSDDDGDGIADTEDNCPVNSNPGQEDCDEDGMGDACAIVQGTSTDCNANDVPDDCDLAAGSTDCNNNYYPDECDPDCNGNGTPDDCDLVDGSALDCNLNGVSDACDILDGVSLDADDDGIPDECAFVDCNVNGVADPTDISSGTSEDCNGNGVPDECEAAEVVASEDFSVPPTDWTFLGNAAYNASEGDVRLVHSDVEFVAGVAFLNDLGLTTDAFEVEFDFEMTAVTGGVPDGSGEPDPDGLAFIVRGTPVTAPGYNGYGLGYKNFPVDSFAVEFDTFQNFVSGQPDDPDSNHVAIDVAGKVDPSLATAYVQPDFEETGVWHGRIRFLDGELTVWVTPPGDVEMKIMTATIPAANIPAVKYLGFGSGTGINSADTDVDNVVITLLTNDCNANGVPDGCDIDDGASADANANGQPDECESCEGDANGDGEVDPLDSGFVLARLGCPVGTGDPLCDAADVNGDGEVDPLDVGYVLSRLGTCS